MPPSTDAPSDLGSEQDVSVVIPVYNGAVTVAAVVERVHAAFAGSSLQVVLVNDGSADDSEAVCSGLVDRYPASVTFVNLSRNFGEHNAVLAGLNRATGAIACVLDDDGQNPPEELPRMAAHLTACGLDVVYGRYADRKHHWARRLGSRFNDRCAVVMLRKPPGLYLSSFKVMTRFVVGEVTRYRGPFPYVDGLILRATSNVGEVEVRHDRRAGGRSGYTLRRLVRLWLNMFLGFSIVPLRLSVILGLAVSTLSVLGLVAVAVDKLWVNPQVTVGVPTVLACVVFFAGVQLVVLGTVGEYVGRIFLDLGGTPQFVVRYTRTGGRAGE